MFLSLLFNKTPVIAQRLSPPFFCKKRVISQKTHIFQLFIFASSFFRFFCFSCYFWCASKNTCFMLPLGPWACHCGPTLRPPGPARANPLLVFPVFGVSHFFNSFDCFPSCLASPLVQNGIQKLPFARQWLPVGPRMLTNDTRTTRRTTKRQKQRHNERRNDTTTKQRTTETPK